MIENYIEDEIDTHGHYITYYGSHCYRQKLWRVRVKSMDTKWFYKRRNSPETFIYKAIIYFTEDEFIYYRLSNLYTALSNKPLDRERIIDIENKGNVYH